jgi:hypothetical protein
MDDTTYRMTCMASLGRDRLLDVDTAEERLALVEQLQESDRLQWLVDSDADYVAGLQ